jgi:pimeloyl-ACP methyl ester carboxylesterase
MKNKFFKKALAILGIFLLIIVVLMTVGPFFIKATPLEGLANPAQAASNESKFITIPFEGTDGIDIHYMEGGSATNGQPYTLVLLHGSNFNAYTWNEVIDFFGEYGRVFAYDQIPYGLSEKLVEGDWTEGNPYSSTAAVEQLFSFLDALEIDNAVLVGNSYGATLAVQAVIANPERIDGLILVDAAIYVQEEMPAWLLNSPQMQRIGPLFARQLGQSEAFIDQTYFDPEKISAERMKLTTIQTQVTNWDIAYWEYLKVWGADAPDYVSMLSKIQQPTLVISGDNDRVVPLADSERLDAELPNSEFIVLANCGHVPQEECPSAFEDAIATWLLQFDQVLP